MSSDIGRQSENEAPTLLAGTRTPRPYLHHKESFQEFTQTASVYATSSDESSRLSRSQSWKNLKSPSESGTEADDEGNVHFKALPAPPLKPRKGLIGGLDGQLDTPTPLLTPSLLNKDDRRFSFDVRKVKKGLQDLKAASDAEKRVAREKFFKRRRAELIRRVCEVGLLGTIGAIIWFYGDGQRSAREWQRGWNNRTTDESRTVLIGSATELLSHSLVFIALLLLYPIRLLLRARSTNTSDLSRPASIRVPAAFDPAPLLYPTYLPVLVILCLPAVSRLALVPNLVLSLSALPMQLFPASHGPGYNMFHWFCAMLPLMISQNTAMPTRRAATKPYMLKAPPPEGLHPETIVTLFALHQALLPALNYLTTTSLLSAESQLLSISLINLLLFADSPQTTILSTVLWVGGVGLFILCRHVIQWNVTLARVPRWKFRRAGRLVGVQQSFLSTLKEGVQAKAGASSLFGKNDKAIESDADEDEDEHVTLASGKHSHKGSLKIDILDSIKRSLLSGDDEGPKSAVEPSQHKALGTLNNATNGGLHKRRNTLPNFQTSNGSLTRPSEQTRRTRSAKSHPFLSLTPFQAKLRTWLYAGYTYLVIVILILGPIQHLITKNALHGHNPFGWAIGYLFGNIQQVRFQIVNWNLEYLIPLPPLFSASKYELLTTPITDLRDNILGAANTRLLLFAYYIAVLIAGLTVVLTLTIVEVDTRRKVFHFMMVAMFLPTIYIDPCFTSLALALVLAIFILLDLIRASQLPPLSKPLARFLTPYVDGRDLRGPVVVSHIFLLIGCAIPLWLSLAALPRTGNPPWQGWEVATHDVSMVAGVICVGMGDAAASLIGRRFGRRKWPWAGGKSLEGSAAFALAVTAGLMFGKWWLRFGGWEDLNSTSVIRVVPKAIICACGASFMEAVLTGVNDNVIVPVVLWLLVKGVKL